MTDIQSTTLSLNHLLSREPKYTSRTFLKHLSILNISLSQTTFYLKHLSFSNNFISQTSLYLEYLYNSNISLEFNSVSWTIEYSQFYILELSLNRTFCNQTNFQYVVNLGWQEGDS